MRKLFVRGGRVGGKDGVVVGDCSMCRKGCSSNRLEEEEEEGEEVGGGGGGGGGERPFSSVRGS